MSRSPQTYAVRYLKTLVGGTINNGWRDIKVYLHVCDLESLSDRTA
jgi:hypothetical protein